ncbi:MAG TPA: choice-of-anchor Q domain-containing protein [Casimicrobiaceae bacterium]|nr:choice-of-anchor Q domain-containing protein [Casimicrobiaceae bacterium]
MRRSSFALVVGALGVIAHGASAAVLNVDTTTDDASLTACDDATPNDCSLRGAIVKANGLADATTINLPAGTYLLSQLTPCFLRGPSMGAFFSSQALCPTGSLTIVGDGAGRTIVDANQPSGNIGAFAPVMFVATTANVTLRGLTLRRGNLSSGSYYGTGGGINNAGTLVIEDSEITDNQTISLGGGVCNMGTLTLLRVRVARNTAYDGGGIFNAERFEACQTTSCTGSVATIAQSTIGDNVAITNGGGISNFTGTVSIDSSTLSHNTATRGGAIDNSASTTMTLTNVTVTGNRADTGGGILNEGATGTLKLNNVTITGNTAKWQSNPTRGIGGGLINEDGGIVTLQNSIIAGNVAAEVDPITGKFVGADCAAFAARNAALTSAGYNLVQDTAFCDIAGISTGNIIGQDPKLGVLADNGGVTSTHAPGTGSPAIDAGNPAIPGAGGAACAATDQRGFLRPFGNRCDIGAVEHNGTFSLARITPASGGNAGVVTALLAGNAFDPGTTVKLARGGQADIVGNPAQVDVGGSAMSATFDLTGKAAGAWDVVVTKSDGTTRTLAGAFTVQSGGGPDLWVDVAGRVIARHAPSRLTVVYGNRGNVDAMVVPLQISNSSQYGLSVMFDIAQPPAQPDQRLTDFRRVSPLVQSGGAGSYTNLPLLLPVVPAGFTGTLQLILNLPPVPTTASTFYLNIDTPYLHPQPDAQIVAGLVQGVFAYAPRGFATTIAPALTPFITQYVANQLQLVADRGRVAFVTSLGNAPQVYSLAQLQIDAALVGAIRTLQP